MKNLIDYHSFTKYHPLASLTCKTFRSCCCSLESHKTKHDAAFVVCVVFALREMNRQEKCSLFSNNNSTSYSLSWDPIWGWTLLFTKLYWSRPDNEESDFSVTCLRSNLCRKGLWFISASETNLKKKKRRRAISKLLLCQLRSLCQCC